MVQVMRMFYEVHMRAFFDIAIRTRHGDFPWGFDAEAGLYPAEPGHHGDLAVAVIYPSPLKDDGYDIAQYTGIHPQYGTLWDFKALLEAAHETRYPGHHRASF